MPTVDGKTLELKAENVGQMIIELKIDEDFIAVVKNGKIVPKSKWESEKIAESDIIEIFSPVSGG